MANVESVVKATMEEIEKMLSSKAVVGDPITVDGKTLIPLVSIGFGFGAGSGTGRMSSKQAQEGVGEGTGGGGGVRPIAIIISDQSGIRIEPIKGGFSGALEKIAENAMSMMRRGQNQEQNQDQAKSSEQSTAA